MEGEFVFSYSIQPCLCQCCYVVFKIKTFSQQHVTNGILEEQNSGIEEVQAVKAFKYIALFIRAEGHDEQ